MYYNLQGVSPLNMLSQRSIAPQTGPTGRGVALQICLRLNIHSIDKDIHAVQHTHPSSRSQDTAESHHRLVPGTGPLGVLTAPDDSAE